MEQMMRGNAEIMNTAIIFMVGCGKVNLSFAPTMPSSARERYSK